MMKIKNRLKEVEFLVKRIMGLELATMLTAVVLTACGTSPVATNQSTVQAENQALEAEATKSGPTYGKVMQLTWQGFEVQQSIDGSMVNQSLRYTAWLQAGPDRLGPVFTRQEVVMRQLIIEARVVQPGNKLVPVNLAVTGPTKDGVLTIVKDGKSVPGVAPGLKSIETELVALVTDIQKNRLYPLTPRGQERAAILNFIETFRAHVNNSVGH